MSDANWKEIVTQLVGAPFLWGGRGPDGYDCWGLVLKALEMHGDPCPGDYVTETPECATRTIADQMAPDQWARQDVPKPGDLVALSTHRAIHHIGIVTPYGILHTTRGFGAAVMPESSLRASCYRRIEYYRWVG